TGMSGGAVVNQLRALMEQSRARVERPDDWQARYEDIPRAVDTGEEKYGKTDGQGKASDQAKPRPPPFLTNIQEGDMTAPPDRQWAVLNRIPMRQPTLLSGEGAVGKSIVELQLCVAHVLGKDWLGSMPELGPAIYVGCEDEVDEIRRRLTSI